MEQQNLYKSTNNEGNCIPEDHVFGLGSGPKATVLGKILKERIRQAESESAAGARPISIKAVMVEDNLETLHKVANSPDLKGKVLPVLASWGYNTPQQQELARSKGYVVLDEKSSSSLVQILQKEKVPSLLAEYLSTKSQA